MPCKLKSTYTQKSTKINVDVRHLVTILFVQYKLVTPSQMFSAWSLSVQYKQVTPSQMFSTCMVTILFFQYKQVTPLQMFSAWSLSVQYKHASDSLMMIPSVTRATTSPWLSK